MRKFVDILFFTHIVNIIILYVMTIIIFVFYILCKKQHKIGQKAFNNLFYNVPIASSDKTLRDSMDFARENGYIVDIEASKD